MALTKAQNSVIRAVPNGLRWLEGPAGSGKTHAATFRLKKLVRDNDVPSGQVLVILPQRTLAAPYYEALADPKLVTGRQVTVTTMSGLARQVVELFWPLIAEEAGFDSAAVPPTFLSLESAQYFMAGVVDDLIERETYFDTVTIARNRLYSQIIDNLNKAAVVGFPYTQIAERLTLADRNADPAQLRIYEEAQTCANRFRAFCLQHNLLDFSLTMELFTTMLWQEPTARAFLTEKYRHLIVDNVEEDTPAAHFVLGSWLEDCDGALLIYDTDAGYRRFLGADPGSALKLRALCDKHYTFDELQGIDADVSAFGAEMAVSLEQEATYAKGDPRAAIDYDDHRYYPQMLDTVAAEIASLVVEKGVDPDEIVVIAPFMGDALRFSLGNRLDAAGVAWRSHRPSRALREEPAAQALLTLAHVAYGWPEDRPSRYDMAYALVTAIAGLDLVRAQLLTETRYNPVTGDLLPFDKIAAATQERITYRVGERFERLRTWLETHPADANEPLDVFFSRLFDEVLARAGFGFHDDFDAAQTASNLVDSARNFRRTVTRIPPERGIAHEYASMVRAGVIADQYVRNWTVEDRDAVLLAPAYTFLMSNRPVDYQFWLNVGSGAWNERLYQPLTHPYVLTQEFDWDRVGRKWTDDDEVRVRTESLYRLTTGLVRRCRKQVYLGFSTLGEQGYEQQGPLLGAVQGMLRRLQQAAGD